MEPAKGRNLFDQESGNPSVQSDIDSAKTMTLIAMAFQAIILVGALIAGPLLLMFGVWPDLPLWIQPLIVSSWIVLATFLVLTYYLVYRTLVEERVPEARAPTLVLGILGLLAGGIVPGIFLLIAYYNITVAHDRILRGSRPSEVGEQNKDMVG